MKQEINWKESTILCFNHPIPTLRHEEWHVVIFSAMNINKCNNVEIWTTNLSFSEVNVVFPLPVCVYSPFLISQTLDRQSKYDVNKREIICFFGMENSWSPDEGFFFFSFAILVDALAYFKSLPKKIAQGRNGRSAYWRLNRGRRAGEREREEGRESLWVNDLKKISNKQ